MLDRTTALLTVALLCGSAAVTVALSRMQTVPTPSTPAPAELAPAATPPAVPPTAAVGPLSLSAGPLAMDLRAWRSLLPVDGGEGLAMIELRAEQGAAEQPRPVAMVVVVDVSSSMSGAKIADARAGARHLVDSLDDDDVLSIVSFHSTGATLLPPSRVGDARSSARSTVAALRPMGGTCMSCGLDLAEAALVDTPAGHDRRIVLLSDGHANEGTSSAPGLGQLVAAARDRLDLSVSTVGVGASYDSALLNLLAERGMGSHLFSPGPGAIARILDRELRRIRGVVARDVVVELSPPPGAWIGAIEGEETRREGDVVQVHLGGMSAGERRRVVVPLGLDPAYAGEALRARFTYAAEVAPGWSDRATIEFGRSEDAGAIEASTDPVVAIHLAQLDAADARSAALVSAASGDVDGARRKLRRALVDVSALQAATPSPELQAELDELQVTTDGLDRWNHVELESMVRNTSAASLEARRGAEAGDRWNGARLLGEFETY